MLKLFFFFFFNDTATTEIYTLSLHDALPIFRWPKRDQSTRCRQPRRASPPLGRRRAVAPGRGCPALSTGPTATARRPGWSPPGSTRDDVADRVAVTGGRDNAGLTCGSR